MNIQMPVATDDSYKTMLYLLQDLLSCLSPDLQVLHLGLGRSSTLYH